VNGLKPNILGNGVFNMAISGRSLAYDIELAKKYVPKMNQLELLIMPLDYKKFYFGRQKNNPYEKGKLSGLTKTRKCMYYKYMGIRIDRFWYWSELLNSKLDFMKRFLEKDAEARECDSLGYLGNNLLERKYNWENWFLPKIIDTTLEANRKALNHLYTRYCILAELTQKRGAKLIILITPKYKTYNNSKNPAVIKEMEAFSASLKQKYPNVEYYDYSTDKRFVDEDFYDASHLNDIGANKFSKIVKEEILDKHHKI
jgi:hypothetical protein